MNLAAPLVVDMFVKIKSRGILRGLVTEMRGDSSSAECHCQVATHLEFVYADE